MYWFFEFTFVAICIHLFFFVFVNLSIFYGISVRRNHIYKKGSRPDVSNYRPISVIKAFTKVMEKHFESSMAFYINSILSQYPSVFRKGCSCKHLLLRFTEEWRKYLDQNKIVVALLMDLSKAFDRLPHDLLIEKL